MTPDPFLWGVVNVTPDSFSDGGRYADAERAIAHGLLLREQGAGVLDIGGESTRPGAERVAPETERERVLPVVSALAERGIPVSIDTMNSSTAAAAIAAGARYVNDVSGGLADPGILDIVADSRAEIVLGHWRGPSARMYERAHYDSIVAEVASELAARAEEAQGRGIPAGRIVLDPGIGFAKTPAQSWEVLRGLSALRGLGSRILVGVSRKRLLSEALGDDASEERKDLATAVASAFALREGAWAVRVHDVAASRDALAVARLWPAS